MNILMLTTHLNSGGITSYLLTMAKGLMKQQHQVFIVSSGGSKLEDFFKIGVKHLQLNIRTKSELDPRIYRALGPLKEFARKENIDVIHSHTRVTQVMGLLLSKLSGRPYVSTCHGFYKTRWSRRVCGCWGQGVIAISPAVKTHLEEDFGVARDCIALIKHGLDVDDFPIVNDELKQRRRLELNLPPDPIIGIIARLADVKGHAILIDAMTEVIAQFPRTKLMIVGEGKLEHALRTQVQKLQLNDTVIFYPVVNRTAEYLPVFDIFAMPSLSEGFGLSLLEAQAVGLPVVASGTGGILSMIQNGNTGILVKPEDRRELAQAIISLLQDREQARQIGIRARENIKRRFSSAGMVQKTIHLYEKVMA